MEGRLFYRKSLEIFAECNLEGRHEGKIRVSITIRCAEEKIV